MDEKTGLKKAQVQLELALDFTTSAINIVDILIKKKEKENAKKKQVQ